MFNFKEQLGVYIEHTKDETFILKKDSNNFIEFTKRSLLIRSPNMKEDIHITYSNFNFFKECLGITKYKPLYDNVKGFISLVKYYDCEEYSCNGAKKIALGDLLSFIYLPCNEGFYILVHDVVKANSFLYTSEGEESNNKFNSIKYIFFGNKL